MVPRSDTSQDLFLEGFGRDLDVRVGLIFHRFIQSGRIEIGKSKRTLGAFSDEFDRYLVSAIDPFGYPESGHAKYPQLLHVNTGQFDVPVTLHLWPKQGRTKATRHPFYEILGRSSEWQGLYFYRWDRMLQQGGWNGLRSQEPHMSYARIAVNIPAGSDDEFRPTVMKDRIENARPLLEVLTADKAWGPYMNAAATVYRGLPLGDSAPDTGRGGPPQPLHAKFVRMPHRPSFRLDAEQLEIDRRLLNVLGQAKAEAVAEIVIQAIRPILGRKRLPRGVRDDLSRLEKAVATLAERRK
jgi:hypothetical protein